MYAGALYFREGFWTIATPQAAGAVATPGIELTGYELRGLGEYCRTLPSLDAALARVASECDDIKAADIAAQEIAPGRWRVVRATEA